MNSRFKYLINVAVLCLPVHVMAQTTLPALVDADLVLTKDESPYYCDGLSISSGVTLQLEAGVVMEMSHAKSISNSGRLVVKGSEADPVTFRIKNEGERWNYISNNGTLIAECLEIYDATRFVSSYGDTVILKSCKTENTYGGIGDDCVGVHNAKKVLVKNCSFVGNPDSGKTDCLDLDNISGDTISGNHFVDFSDDGIDIGTGSSSVYIADNYIANCDMGISVGENSTVLCEYNIVTHCNAGIQSHYGAVVESVNNTLYANVSGIRAFHNYSEETSGGTIHIKNTIVNKCTMRLVFEKPNSVYSFNYCLLDSSVPGGIGNIVGEAGFKDTISFELADASLAIDSGDPNDVDADGSRRDMGARPTYYSGIKLIEVSPSNLSLLMDEEGEYSDWVLVYNESAEDVSLAGYYLSDNPANLSKYRISENLVIPAHDTLRFWAKNVEIGSGQVLPFKLSGSGEYFSIRSADGIGGDELLFPRVPVDYVYRRDVDSDRWYFVNPEAPEKKYVGLAPEPVMTPGGGEHSFPLNVDIAPLVSGNEIYYSLDGSKTDAGSKFESSIRVDEDVTVRASSMRTNFVPSYTLGEAYFAEDTYSMPVISLSTDEENLYGGTGIYTNYSKSGPLWERPVSFMYYGEEKSFGAVSGIRIQGGNSVFMPKKSFRLHFRGGYGYSRLEGTPFHAGPSSFKNLVLRAGYDDDITSYTGTMLRDPFSTELWNHLGELATFSTFNVLLLNNNYWGMYNVRESVNNYFVEDHLGMKDFDLVRFQKWGADLKYGTMDAWDELMNYFNTQDLSRTEAYDEVSSFMDMNSLLNLLSFVHCAQFRSWTWGAFVVKPKGGRWIWTIWDTDRSYSTLSWNGFTEYANTANEKWPNIIPQKLMHNERFKRELVNRNCDLLNTMFVPEAAISVYDSLVAVVAPEMEAEFERWSPGKYHQWAGRNESIRSFLRARPNTVYQQMKSYFSLEDTVHVRILVEGNGWVKLNSLNIRAQDWTGVYMLENDIHLEAIPSSGSRFLRWENISESSVIDADPAQRVFKAVFEESWSGTDRLPLVLNEIMYHPVSDTESEWVELHNPNSFAISLDGYRFNDGGSMHDYLLEDALIPERGYYVLAGDLGAFQASYSEVANVRGSFSQGLNAFSLGNGGETLYLINEAGEIEDSVSYGDSYPWPIHADGFGPSLQLLDPGSDNMLAQNWYCNTSNYSTPGSANTELSARKNTSTLSELSIFPNPSHSYFYLQYSSRQSGGTEIRIYDLSGVLVYRSNNYMQAGENQIQVEHGIDIGGSYVVQLIDLSTGQRQSSLLLIR